MIENNHLHLQIGPPTTPINFRWDSVLGIAFINQLTPVSLKMAQSIRKVTSYSVKSLFFMLQSEVFTILDGEIITLW
jgi:hypothetical protein